MATLKNIIIILMLVMASCSFKPSHSDLVKGGFKEKTITYKGDEFKMYDLVTDSWDLQYYPKENTWIIEAGGYAAPAKINKKKFKAAIEKSQTNLKK